MNRRAEKVKEKRGRPKLSPAQLKRARKYRILAERLRLMCSPDVRYCVLNAKDSPLEYCTEFSGPGGAKEILDRSDLPTGSVVIRLCDGVELARIQTMSKHVDM